MRRWTTFFQLLLFALLGLLLAVLASSLSMTITPKSQKPQSGETNHVASSPSSFSSSSVFIPTYERDLSRLRNLRVMVKDKIAAANAADTTGKRYGLKVHTRKVLEMKAVNEDYLAILQKWEQVEGVQSRSMREWGKGWGLWGGTVMRGRVGCIVGEGDMEMFEDGFGKGFEGVDGGGEGGLEDVRKLRGVVGRLVWEMEKGLWGRGDEVEEVK